ncbi:hypothetical protein A2Z33_03865 [Candidatus Gottesmanbacteria bacterium RBG_16_52_11]|uniref:Membrane protein 6-pyruvoyl-tetrahydropterin synthase-related domain-containing protein n=1 Tax=Candidatus Gottesmanbacteria bacterium RBG_16_52_11 TaxID=1798374 RepID=A0A1F5YVN3_9BACT|nr:MAG: hypothetical protein A2Z33_03865 [Candidatus Gottesmanbacteria bacterium RBG_16_52_11]
MNKIRIPERMIQLSPPVLYLIVLIVLLGKALFLPPDFYLFGWDTLDIQYFTREFFHQSLAGGTIPWWDPYRFAGNPFAAAADGPVFFYPPTILFVFLPVARALTWFYLIHIFSAMTGTYLLLRRWFRPVPAWAGGIVFGLSGYFFPRILAGTAGNLASASYLPWVFAAFVTLSEPRQGRSRGKQVAIAGLVFGLQLLAGDQRMAVFTFIACLIAVVFAAIRQKHIRPVIGAVLAVLTGVGIAAVQLVPQVQYMQLSQRTELPSYETASDGALSPERIGELLFPFTNSYSINNAAYPPYAESPFYTGILPLVLAVAGLTLTLLTSLAAIFRRQPAGKSAYPALLFGTVAAVALWIAMAPHAPVDIFRILWKHIPLFSFVRLPVRFLLLFALGISGLTALALTQLGKRVLQIFAAVFILAELVPFAARWLLPQPVPPSQHDSELVSVLTGDPTLNRIHLNYFYVDRLGQSIDMNAPVVYRRFGTNGYSPLILKNYYDFYVASLIYYDARYLIGMNQLPPITVLSGKALDFLNVKYLYNNRSYAIGADPTSYLTRIDNPNKWFTLYENRNVLPRFYLAPAAKRMPDRDGIFQAIRHRTEDYTKTILVTEPLAGNSDYYAADCLKGEIGQVTVLSYGLNRVELLTDAPCDAYLASSEVMYPGWAAEIDGRRAPLLTGNLAFRTVFVPEGKHTLVMKFVPVSFLTGGGISIGTVLIWFLILRRNKFQAIRNRV